MNLFDEFWLALPGYCCKFSNNQIENYFFLAANREVQLNNQFYKTTRELRTLFKNILERRRLRSANSLKKKHWGSARDPRTWQKKSFWSKHLRTASSSGILLAFSSVC